MGAGAPLPLGATWPQVSMVPPLGTQIALSAPWATAGPLLWSPGFHVEPNDVRQDAAPGHSVQVHDLGPCLPSLSPLPRQVWTSPAWARAHGGWKHSPAMSLGRLLRRASSKASDLLTLAPGGGGGPPTALDGEIIYSKNNVCVHPPEGLQGLGEHHPGEPGPGRPGVRAWEGGRWSPRPGESCLVSLKLASSWEFPL